MLENARFSLKIYSIIAILIVGIRMFFRNKTPFDLAALVFIFVYVVNE